MKPIHDLTGLLISIHSRITAKQGKMKGIPSRQIELGGRIRHSIILGKW